MILRLGNTKTIAVSATGDGLRYQWYESLPAGSPFVALPGETGVSLDISPGENAHYRVRVSNDCGEVTSKTWKVTVWETEEP